MRSRDALELTELSVQAVSPVIRALTVDAACSLLLSRDVPAAVSVHPNAVLDDQEVQGRDLLITVRHPAAGPYVQVGIPLQLSVDRPAVKGPAPSPGRSGKGARR